MYQFLLCPDGIIINLKRSYTGRRHDAGIFRQSGLYEILPQKATFPHENFLIYGDQVYGLRELLLRPYTQHEIAGNIDRQNVIQEFAFLDLNKNEKLLLQEVGH